MYDQEFLSSSCLVQFYQVFSGLQKNDFYVTGEVSKMQTDLILSCTFFVDLSEIKGKSLQCVFSTYGLR